VRAAFSTQAKLVPASAHSHLFTAGAAAGVAAAVTGVFLFTVSPAEAAGTYSYDPNDVNWVKLTADLEDLCDDPDALNPGQDGFPGAKGGGGPVGPMLVRLAWHCSGTYSAKDGTGGSDGATMRFAEEAGHGGNAGLGHARNLLENIKAKHPKISYADLYIYAGKVALELMGANEIGFSAGRTDATDDNMTGDSRFTKDGRLPDADGGPRSATGMTSETVCQHLREDVFYRMGFNDREIVVLSGAHSLGHCHTDRSGFWGPWTFSPTTLSNEYFKLLLKGEGSYWKRKTSHKGRNWTGPPQWVDPTGEIMMLPSDMALIQDKSFKRWTDAYAEDDELFQEDFVIAYQKLNELGCKNLKKMTWRNYLLSGKREVVFSS
jgi:cytochrome c peroxidase